MNINKLTIGQAKELISIFGNGTQADRPHLNSRYIGQYVIVRSRSEGVQAGYVELADETGVILKDARRLWYHKPAEKSESWFEGVANHGLSSDSKVSPAVSEKSITGESYSITPVTDKAKQSITEAASYAQS